MAILSKRLCSFHGVLLVFCLSSLPPEIDDLAGKLRGIEPGDKNLASTEALLQELGRRLDEPISWDIKRQLIEIFARGIRVETIEVVKAISRGQAIDAMLP